jgi:polyhydroxyalkanoate synthase subunit PhaC
MEESAEYDLEDFMRSLSKAGRQVTLNYLRNFSGFNHDNRDIALTYSSFFSKIFIHPPELFKVYNFWLDYLNDVQHSWQVIASGKNFSESQNDLPRDKRFSSPEWTGNPWFSFLSQNYLQWKKMADKIINELDINTRAKKKLKFYNNHYLDVMSPSNYLLTNPEALKLMVETKGKSVWNGMNNFVNDLAKGRISQTDEGAFEVGRNLATTPGSVIYENELIQLIQYTSATENVLTVPVLIIPPWINKYYILDLDEKKSFICFLVQQGLTVFVISWKNPSRAQSKLSFDDYVEKGALKAIEVATEISGSERINTIGYCLGGTLLGVASAILGARGEASPVNSTTFLAAMIDFTEIGPLGDVIDSAMVKKLERGELLKGGLMPGHDMERAFNLIRANDLIWNYVVSNYLKGIKPPPFDVLYWTNDNTNLPAGMYIYYMKEMIFGNKLGRKNALRISNTPIDIGKISCPVFAIAFHEDHISPPQTAFTTTELVSGPVEFIYGGSGHVMGVINPPYKKKYGFRTGGELGFGFEKWVETAKENEGSWWSYWVEKLKAISGKEVEAPEKPGSEKYKVIEPAPGRYVKEKVH